MGGELVALEKRVAGRLAVPSGDETFLSPQTCAKIQQRFAALKAEDHRRKKLPTRLESFFKHLVRNDESPDCKHFLEHMSGGIQLDHNTASRVIANYCDEEIRDFKETAQEICKIFDLKIEKKINIANRSKSENRHPILIYNEKNVPNNYTKIDAYQVDTMAIAPHRLKRDRNFLDAISYNRKDTNLLDVAKHSLNLSYIKLLEFCDRKIKFYDGKVQDEDAWAALLTIIMMQGFNLEVALLMKVRGDFGCSKVTIRSLKRRANNKLIKAEINEPYILKALNNLFGNNPPSKKEYFDVFPENIREKAKIAQRRILNEFGKTSGLSEKNYKISPSQIRPTCALRWVVCENIPLEDVRERLHHDNLNQTIQYVDGLIYRMHVDLKAVAGLKYIDEFLKFYDPGVRCILQFYKNSLSWGQEHLRYQSIAVSRQANCPAPRVCFDRRDMNQARPLAPAGNTADLICKLVRFLNCTGPVLLDCIERGAPAPSYRPHAVRDFVSCAEILILFSGFTRADLKEVKAARLSHVNGAWRARMRAGHKPLSEVTVFALEWLNTVRTARACTARQAKLIVREVQEAERQAGHSASTIQTFLKRMQVPTEWGLTSDCIQRKAVYTPARLSKLMTSLWTIRSNSDIEVLEYLRRNHALDRAETSVEDWVRLRCSDPAISPMKELMNRHGENIDNLIESERASATSSSLNHAGRRRLPVRKGRIDVEQELLKRIELLQEILETGICPSPLDLSSIQAMSSWSIPSIGIGALGRSKKYTKGHRLGSKIAEIEALMKAIQSTHGANLRIAKHYVFPPEPLPPASASEEEMRAGLAVLEESLVLAAQANRKWTPQRLSAHRVNLKQFYQDQFDHLNLIGVERRVRPFHGFEPEAIARWNVSLQDCAASTRKKKLATLQQALNLIGSNLSAPVVGGGSDSQFKPVAKIGPSRSRRFRPDGLEFAKAFHAAAPTRTQSRNQMMIRLTMEFGLRASEIARWPSSSTAGVDEDGGYSVEFRQKGGAFRTVYVRKALADRIASHAAEVKRRKDSRGANLLFLTNRGEPMSPEAVSEAITQCLLRAGHPLARPHHARAYVFSSIASAMLRSPTDRKTLKALEKVSGHKDFRTTLRYYVDPKVRNDLMNALATKKILVRPSDAPPNCANDNSVADRLVVSPRDSMRIEPPDQGHLDL